MNDDELDRLLRASRPNLPRQGDPLTEREHQMLHAIMSSDPEHELNLEKDGSSAGPTPTRPARAEVIELPVRSRRHRRTWIALPAAAVLLAALFLFQPWKGTQPAHAASPPMLTLTPVQADLREVVKRAQEQLLAGPDRPAERRSESEGWYLQTEVESSGTAAVIAPQEYLTEWREDLSGRTVAVAGAAYVPQDGRRVAPPDGAAPPAGTVLADNTYRAGEMPVRFPGQPPSNADLMRSYLEAGGAASTGDAVSCLQTVRALLDEWTLSGNQQAALLQVLGDLDGVEVAGETTDRLGRPTIAIRIASSSTPAWEYLLMIGRDTGRVLANEDIYLGGLPELDLSAPTVTTYVAWK
ncbi:MAG: hypothetical protein QM804_13115 [Propionicimonas sp.]